MDDFSALNKLKKLSLSSPLNGFGKKNGRELEEKSETGRNTGPNTGPNTAAAAAAKISYATASKDAKDQNEPDSDDKNVVSAGKFDYYNNAYQRYMAEHSNGDGDAFDDDASDGSASASLSPPRVHNKDTSLELDLSAISPNNSSGRSAPRHHLHNPDPQAEAFNILDLDPFARFKEKDESSPAEPIKPIGSVGAVKKAYRDREKEREKELARRHANNVIKTAASVKNATTSVYEGKYDVESSSKSQKKSKPRTMASAKPRLKTAAAFAHPIADHSTVSGLSFDLATGSAEGDWAEGSPGSSSVKSGDDEEYVLVDGLQYSSYSCDSSSRLEMLNRIQRVLQAGSGVILQTEAYSDTLDGKMLLKTLSQHMAMFTENGFLPAEIRPTLSGCLQMTLLPKARGR